MSSKALCRAPGHLDPGLLRGGRGNPCHLASAPQDRVSMPASSPPPWHSPHLVALAYVLGPNLGVSRQSRSSRWEPCSRGRLTAPKRSATGSRNSWAGSLGALLLWGTFSSSPSLQQDQDRSREPTGWGTASHIHINVGGASSPRCVLTAFFVFVILGVTSKIGNTAHRRHGDRLTLTVVHLIGIPITGTSVTRPKPRPGPHRRRDCAAPGVAVHRGPSVGGILAARPCHVCSSTRRRHRSPRPSRRTVLTRL